MDTLQLSGHALTLETLEAFLRADPAPNVVAEPAAVERVDRCADFCHELSLGDKAYYGINTGFGKFARTRISVDDASRLQTNLLRSHATGMGDLLPNDIVRLMMLLRVNSLLWGFSGVSTVLVEQLIAFINLGFVPVIPMYGSVGASGDLAPLAHMALPLIGEGEVSVQGRRVPAKKALSEAGLEPLTLRPKEGLALINGTQMMTAFAARDLIRTRRYLKASMLAAAMSLEAYEATDLVFDERIARLKNHPGPAQLAAGFRKIHQDSEIIASHEDCARVQDPYSFRCIPQVLGAVVDTMEWVQVWLEREINAVTDNPLMFRSEGEVISGGNFHGEHMALALEGLALAAAEIASIAERRIDKLIDNDGDKMPKCLIADPGLHSGLMITQYLAASLVSENKVHAHPAVVDNIPTSMGFEDHVSMGSLSGFKLSRILDNVARVVAIELLCGAQALDFHRPLKPGKGARLAHDYVRRHVPFIEEDEILSGHLARLESIVVSGEMVDAVEAEIGILIPKGED